MSRFLLCGAKNSAATPVSDEEFTNQETRDATPAHLLAKIQRFSRLSEHRIQTYETREFESGHYKWRVVIRLDDIDHVSVFFVLADTTSFPTGWEVNAMLSVLLYNQIADNYLCFHGKVRRFHAMKTILGFSRLVSKKALMQPSNGYVVNDICVLGAEVHVIHNQPVVDHLLLKDGRSYSHDTTVSDLSQIKEGWFSEIFTVADCKWKVKLYGTGDSTEETSHQGLSVFLYCVDLAPPNKVRANFSISIERRSNNAAHILGTYSLGPRWFTSSSEGHGWSNIKTAHNDFTVGFELSVDAVSCDAP